MFCDSAGHIIPNTPPKILEIKQFLITSEE